MIRSCLLERSAQAGSVTGGGGGSVNYVTSELIIVKERSCHGPVMFYFSSGFLKKVYDRDLDFC